MCVCVIKEFFVKSCTARTQPVTCSGSSLNTAFKSFVLPGRSGACGATFIIVGAPFECGMCSVVVSCWHLFANKEPHFRVNVSFIIDLNAAKDFSVSDPQVQAFPQILD